MCNSCVWKCFSKQLCQTAIHWYAGCVDPVSMSPHWECVNVLTLIIASVSVRYFIASLSPHTLHHVISDPVCAVCNLYVVYWYVGQFVTLDLV